MDNEIQDKQRFSRILSKLLEVWKNYPDLRFNQLVYYINSVSDYSEESFFYLTDEEFEDCIKKATDSGGQLYKDSLNLE
jgi:hypothetical protein